MIPTANMVDFHPAPCCHPMKDAPYHQITTALRCAHVTSKGQLNWAELAGIFREISLWKMRCPTHLRDTSRKIWCHVSLAKDNAIYCDVVFFLQPGKWWCPVSILLPSFMTGRTLTNISIICTHVFWSFFCGRVLPFAHSPRVLSSQRGLWNKDHLLRSRFPGDGTSRVTTQTLLVRVDNIPVKKPDQ